MDTIHDGTDASLVERYKIDDDDEDSKNWRRMLDFESSIKTESDWYSTRTFQVFLDALDINQPASLDRSRSDVSREPGTPVNGPKKTSSNSKEPQPDKKQIEIRGDKKATTNSNQQQTPTRSGNAETILSAEALKILSELPDLTHMSATRSFIFPNNRNKTPPKKNR